MLRLQLNYLVKKILKKIHLARRGMAMRWMATISDPPRGRIKARNTLDDDKAAFVIDEEDGEEG